MLPSHLPHDVEQLEHNIRMYSLNQNIKRLYFEIQQEKRSIRMCKQKLHCTISDQFMYYRIMSEFEDNNYHVKECEKARLKDKFHWLLLNYYPYSVRDDGQNYVMPDPSTRVTVIDNDPQNPLDIRPEELSVLALGLKFALSRKVDEKLVDEVEVNLAQCAYMCRWKKHWESSDETSARVTSMYEQAKQHKCPFQRPFIAAPPVEDPTLELNLRLLNFLLWIS